MLFSRGPRLPPPKREPGGGDAGIREEDDAYDFPQDVVGDLVVEGAADAVDEEVGEEEAGGT